METAAYYYSRQQTKVHNDIFPETFRMLIVGQSGSGKTTLLMRLLLEENLLNYDKLYVFAKSLYQPEYEVLKAGLKNGLPKSYIGKLMKSDEIIQKHQTNIDDVAQQLAEKLGNASQIDCEFHDCPDDIPDPRSVNKSIRNLIVFDDIMTDKKQTPAENWFTRGRSSNADAIYLAQNYTHLPLHTVRSNSNFMMFFKSSPLVVEQLYRNFASVVMTCSEFKRFCNDAWKNKFGFIVIDLSQDYESGNKYRNRLELNSS